MKETINRSHFAPEGWRVVTPRIVVHDAERLVEFLNQVFGATGDYRQDIPSVIRIGDSQIMISDAGIRSPMSAFLYVYVSDTDPSFDTMMRAGRFDRSAKALASSNCSQFLSRDRSYGMRN